MAPTRFAILFVCTGNICRSPTAEAVFRHKVKALGWEDRFVIDSAGTHDYHVGDAPDVRSMATASARGVTMDNLRARQFEAADFERFDLILAMDGGHYEILKKMAPGAGRAKLAYFLNHIAESGPDVPDPYYGGAAGFERVFDLVDEACERILADFHPKY